MPEMFVRFRIYLLLIFLFGCADENPDLVNPKPQNESVRVRFFNLAADKKDRILVLDSKVQLGPVKYGEYSKGLRPPSDSSNAVVLLDGKQEYKLNRKIKFSRDNHYTVFALPSAPNDTTPYRDMDTLITASTLVLQPRVEDMAYIRAFNAIADSGRKYTVNIGCPNGMSIASQIRYRTLSPQSLIRASGISVSITRFESGKPPEFIGLVDLDLESFKQYMILIMPGNQSSEKEDIFLIDEMDEGANKKILLIPSKDGLLTKIKPVNFCQSAVDFKKYDDSLFSNGIFASLQGKFIGNLVSTSACKSAAFDKLSVISGGNESSTISAQLEVGENYTLMTFDSAQNAGNLTIMATPYRMNSFGRAMVRVVNGSWKKNTLDTAHLKLTVSIAARDYLDADSNYYKAGDVITSKIGYGEISKPALVEPGENIPITVFTAQTRTKLIYTTIIDRLEANKKYLLVITNEYPSGEYKMYLLEDDEFGQSNKNLDALPEGVFIQFVNLIPGRNKAEISTMQILKRAKINYGESLATIIPEGINTLRLNNSKDTNINADSKKRLLFILTGDEKNTELVTFEYTPLVTSPDNYLRRFINATRDVKMMSVKENNDSTLYIADSIGYGKASGLEPITQERSLSLLFYDGIIDKLLTQGNALYFSKQKNYSIILGGRSSDKSYKIVNLQEY